MNRRLLLIGPLLFASGFCVLVYQTTWLREFRLFFGASTAANAAVLGVFMGGLGAGSIFLGRRSEGLARPLAYYAKLEMMIAGSAALTPVFLWLASHLYLAAGGTLTMGVALGSVVRLLLSALVLGLPTFLMGGHSSRRRARQRRGRRHEPALAGLALRLEHARRRHRRGGRDVLLLRGVGKYRHLDARCRL